MPSSGKRYLHDSVFTAPHFGIPSRNDCRDIWRILALLHEEHAIPSKRYLVMQALVRRCGIERQPRISQEVLGTLAGNAGRTTVWRAITELEAMGLIRVHHICRRTAAGTVQDISYYQVIAFDKAVFQAGTDSLLTKLSNLLTVKRRLDPARTMARKLRTGRGGRMKPAQQDANNDAIADQVAHANRMRLINEATPPERTRTYERDAQLSLGEIARRRQIALGVGPTIARI